MWYGVYFCAYITCYFWTSRDNIVSLGIINNSEEPFIPDSSKIRIDTILCLKVFPHYIWITSFSITIVLKTKHSGIRLSLSHYDSTTLIITGTKLPPGTTNYRSTSF